MTGVYVWNENIAKTELESLRAYAEDPAHHYDPAGDARIPGTDRHFFRSIPFSEGPKGYNVLRLVFTVTKDPKARLWRHLSVSTRKREPNPAMVELLAQHLGFKGGLKNCLVERGRKGTDNEGAIIIAQPYELP